MLAIAFSGHELRYIHWTRTGAEVRLNACQVIPWESELDPFRDVARVRDLIQRIIVDTGDADETPIFVTVDAGLCHFALQEIDPQWNAREQLDFIQRERFGDEPLYASFQYPLSLGAGQYLNVDCPMVLRRAVENALPATADLPHSLSVGLFAAHSYAQRVVPALERGRRLFWRTSAGGHDQFLEIEDGEFKAIHFFQRHATAVQHLRTIGQSGLQVAIATFVEQLSGGREAEFPEVDDVFVYLGSGSSSFLEGVLQVEQSALSLLNPFWRWNWPEVPEADNRFTQSAFTELADAVWAGQDV
ncbi:MAG: hypothetical protein IH971_08250 [Candidatus Marinimicrobia bacterium]|nr:hypothetical protein [Candidatus Neomarinimicrobiota bacterium]